MSEQGLHVYENAQQERAGRAGGRCRRRAERARRRAGTSRARAGRPDPPAEPPHRAAQARAARTGQGAPAPAAGRDRLRAVGGGDPDRPHRRSTAVPLRRELRAAIGHRADPVLLGQAHPAPAQPRRRRQLNHALHIVAITRANHDPATKTYLERKEAEGKTKKGALRCLKRHLARRFTTCSPSQPRPPNAIRATAPASTPPYPDRVRQASPAPPPHTCPASVEKARYERRSLDIDGMSMDPSSARSRDPLSSSAVIAAFM
jgi:hypothetical protein